MSTDPASKYDSFGSNFCKLETDTYPFINPEIADLKGKHVLITGASKGIGYDTAISYARAGASAIAVAARSPLDNLVKAMEAAASKANRTCPKIIPLTVDVTKKEDLEAAAYNVKTMVGHIDIIILNSGALEKAKPIAEQDPDVWWNIWNVNIFGQFLTMRSFIPLMLASPNTDKTIIALSSIGATLTRAGLSAYQPSKLAIARIMEFANAEYASKGVLAYSIHPGGVMTELASALDKDMHPTLTDTPQLPADTLVWLTNERREWLAGRYVSVKWNMQELESKRADIEKRDLLKFRLAMGGEDPSLI